ncbi:FAD-containing oxidoreductase [Staphylococcus pseudintermedius]|uniref:FAD-containing oxidoreductase n=1 Tax=Staphylococcus pseudintermedius TaxID=283734 RepID=A0A8H9BZK3_STAPS|nr:hypothiocyanous acid reductase MerA [Staphylococcus pseudintermedius]ADV06838.1 Putative Dihydrolipoamide dehydrogenase; Mercuric ion reductase; PF00070 family, FAD-dependent NAD(P)-disulfide oxidoreductase [Staphylococcus pseudintermedius HKU10-03]ANS88403.1 Putative Dihydrolipoamide dehydrogenase; Mercuric ion reductase; PF00070 family, FAD-dependent NAD(P)-disulfide oxidoreductase [Staphylococcus pseudintermedius]ASQ49573.1 dihydrolipoamide dehydrogenase [Staphylococcus pseudintermedius]E
MNQYDLIVVGFGKAGKTLAKFAAQQGKRVAVIEKSAEMYGGTCINIGCIPSKVLVHDGIEAASFNDAMQRKRDVVNALNSKNYHNLADEETVDVINMTASFKSAHAIDLLNAQGEAVQTIEGKNIVINTGAKSVIPNIKGIDTSQRVYDSKAIMDLTQQPKRLVIVGGGYIALEFASIFANFGTTVTVLERSDQILKREDAVIAQQVTEDLTQKGIQFIYNAETEAIEDEADVTKVVTNQGTFEADAVLVATGRKPNTEGLNLEAAGVQLGQRGEIIVNDKLQTSVDHIYAVGDVHGGLQFTYISLDDFRIVKSQLFGDGKRTLAQRGVVPYTMFIDPPMARVGMTATEAREKGYDILENQVAVNTMPRHKINNDTRGLFKAVVDAKSGQVLGATLYGQQSEELINIVKLAIDQQLPYAVLRDNIYTHPTMAESFNDLFNV